MPPTSTSQTTTSPMSPPWTGFVQTTGDALLLLEAARRGIIPRVTRRLVDGERRMITSGSVFVFDEDESGIKRWTDGFFWSPSRILGNFLIYRETDKKGAGSGGSGKKGGKRARNGAGEDNNDDGHVHSSRPHPRRSSDTDEEVPARKTHSLSRPRDPPTDLALRPDKQRERVLLGSLTNSAKFKPDGLMKKTFSLTINGITQHLISYYRISDVEAGRLRCPSSLPELASLSISPEYLDVTHFRNPPKIELDADGIPRYRGESDDLDLNPDPGSLISSKHHHPSTLLGVGNMQRQPLFTQGPRPVNPLPPQLAPGTSSHLDYSSSVPGSLPIEPGATNIPAPGPGHRNLSDLAAYHHHLGQSPMGTGFNNSRTTMAPYPHPQHTSASPPFSSSPSGSPSISPASSRAAYPSAPGPPTTPSPPIAKRHLSSPSHPVCSSIGLGLEYHGTTNGTGGATRSRTMPSSTTSPSLGRRRGASISSLDGSPYLGSKKSLDGTPSLSKSKRTNPYPQIRARRSPPSHEYSNDHPGIPPRTQVYAQYDYGTSYSNTPPPPVSQHHLPPSAGGGYDYAAARPANPYYTSANSSPYPSPTPPPANYYSTFTSSPPAEPSSTADYYNITPSSTPPIPPTSHSHVGFYAPAPAATAITAGGYSGVI